MKTKIFLFNIIAGLLLLFSMNGYPQWMLQTSNTTAHFSTIKFLNSLTGWASGTNGTIVKTTNGGVNWIVQMSGLTNKELRGLFIVDSNIVYASGYYDTFLKTTNGGLNWLILRNGSIPNNISFTSMYFLNANTGWFCGSNWQVFKTSDGGLTFDIFSIPLSIQFDIYFKNEMEGLLCGETAAMFRTTNGGLNWYVINVPVANQSADFRRFSFINENTGFVIGVQNSKLYRTTNFGISWDSVARIYGMDESYSLYFIDGNTGFSCGSFGLLYKTTNGGFNWRQENVLQFGSGYLADVIFINYFTGWTVGASGKILYTETGGSPLLSISSNEKISKGFSLEQNYPNPFNPATKIKFSIPLWRGEGGRIVTLKIFDLTGREVQTLINEALQPGTYEVTFNGSSLNSGVYFYQLKTENFTVTRKMLLIK